jgi:hypothetical protein
LSVFDKDSTGPDPRVDVHVCVPASDGDEYWIVTHADVGWFAKTQISGTGSYTVRLLHGSGAEGQHRDFVLVAARTSDARDWLRANKAADAADDDSFSRDDLPNGVEWISDRVSSTS